MTETRKLTKSDLNKTLLLWLEFGQASYSYERMQGPDVCHAMVPVINRMYDENDHEGRKKVMLRHMTFFNTTLSFGSAIIGLVTAMEEKAALGEEEFDDEAINSLKSGLMGPIAGIGDTINQGILLPILLSIGISMGIEGNVMGPILYVILMVGAIWAIAYSCFKLGYEKGGDAIVAMMGNGTLNRVISAAGVLGCTVMGALVAKYVSLATTVSFEMTTGTFDLQTAVFDRIMPKMLPLALTLICYRAMSKGTSALKMMVILVVVGLLLGLVGII